MKRLLSLIFVCGMLAGGDALGQVPAEGESSGAEAAIRQSIDSYVEAFNSGDAKTLAGHWSVGGEFITPRGERLQGRQQLEDDFAAYFAKTKGAKLELPETAITLLSPNVAIETGVARVVVAGQPPTETQYEAIHTKTPDGWKIDRISEQAPPGSPPSHYEQLQELEWLIGSWVDNDVNASIETNCRWTTNQNFLVRTFKVFIEDRVDFEGTQIIGWDPSASAIRSWMFDSDGGFGVGRWSRGENDWHVRTLNVLPDGRRASATNIYQLVDDNTLLYRSIGRQIDGELLPSIEPVTIARVHE